ncbi:LPS translocon maturation chaperone LptM [Litorimonas sp. RW-G-Af-16]|uniref:LPS translocon maturation chaperone LptM n=1 Tax=Litorimonas sp. RW-G-Af-16 TaxID=3241168 RepID=UPI00390C62BE
MTRTYQSLTRNALILAIAASFALSACGIKGELKTPPPVWGEEKPTPPDAEPAQS